MIFSNAKWESRPILRKLVRSSLIEKKKETYVNDRHTLSPKFQGALWVLHKREGGAAASHPTEI